MGKGKCRGWSLRALILMASMMIGSTTAAADELDDLARELASQKQRTAELEDKLNQLEARQRLKERALQQEMEQLKADRPTPAATDLRTYWRDGLRFTTADGMFDLRVGGRLMFDWVWMGEDDQIEADFGRQEDGVRFRRGRFYLRGSIYENMDYMLQIDFAGGQVALKDACLGLSDLPVGKLRMGQFKEPFSLEELTSSNQITFLERALPNVFAPSRNAGFMFHDTLFDRRMTWAAGLFRDFDDTAGLGVADAGYSVTARLTGLPWYEDNGASLLHLGVAYSHRDPDAVRYRARPETSIIDHAHRTWY